MRAKRDRVKIAFILSVMFLFNACAGAPFQKVKFGTTEGLTAEGILENFKQKIPPQFELMESVVFKYKGRTVTALAYTQIDEDKKMLTVAGFSPLGIMLAEVKSGGDKNLEYAFTLPQVKAGESQRLLAEIIAADVRSIYFNRVPSASSEIEMRKDRVLFRDEIENRKVEWVFGGPQNLLFQKRYYSDGKVVRRVRYFNYKVQDSYVYPSEIFLENFDKKYRLVLRMKEIFK